MTSTPFKPTYAKKKKTESPFQKFERKLDELGFGNDFKMAILDTCDTADFAKLKLEELGLPFTATDVLTLTGLIMQHQRTSKRR